MPCYSHADIIISEMMASNGASLKDEDGEFPDWIEIFNAGDDEVNLSRWTLTDDPLVPKKWEFPDMDLHPGSFLVVFASGKDRDSPFGPLHLNFKLQAAGEYLALMAPDGRIATEFSPSFPPQKRDQSFGIPMGADEIDIIQPTSDGRYHKPNNADQDDQWKLPEWDAVEAGWRRSKAAIGYETSGDDFQPYLLTKITPTAGSVYLRLPFSLDAFESVQRLVLEARSDDGFIAYLNGTRVAGFKAPDQGAWNSLATSPTPDREAVNSKEFDLSSFAHLLKSDNLLAVHVLNSSNTNNDLLWAGNMRIQSGGIFDPSAKIQPEYLKNYSPGGFNTSSTEPELTAPVITPTGGVFTESKLVELLHPEPGTEIRFTSNGSLPTERSNIYSRPLDVKKTVTITARAFKPGWKPSPPSSAVFIAKSFTLENWHSNLPLMVLQKETFGLLREDNLTPSRLLVIPSENRKSLWDAPATVTHAGIKIRGSSTSRRPKPSLGLEIQDYLGRDKDSSILDMPAESDWVLLGPFEFDRALMRNPFIYELSRQIGRYAPRTRFVEVFLTSHRRTLTSSDYLGVYAVIEKIKRSGDRVDIDKLTPLDTDPDSVTGGYLFKIDRLDPGDTGLSAGGQTIAFVDPKEEDINLDQRQYLRSFLNSFNVSLNASTSGYEEYIDPGTWADHHILNEFSKNPDGFRLSAYLYKPRGERMVAGPAWDFDRTMGSDSDSRSLNPVGWSQVRDYGWYGPLLRKPDFQQLWIDNYQQYREGPMSIENMHNIIDTMAFELRDAAERNFDRWPEVTPNGGRYQVEVNQLKSWVSRRVNWIDSLYPEKPKLNISPLQIAGDPFEMEFLNDGVTVQYRTDGLDPRVAGGGSRSGNKTFSSRSAPVSLDMTTPITARIRKGSNWSGLLNQVVVIGPSPKLIPVEIHYHPFFEPSPDSTYSESDFEFIEFLNAGDNPIQLHGWKVDGGIRYSFPTEILAPGQLMVLARNPEALASIHDLGNSNALIFGPYDGRLSNNQESITVTDTATRQIMSLTYTDTAPWPIKPDGSGHSLVLKSQDLNYTLPNNWTSGSPNNGDPGSLTPIGVQTNIESVSLSNSPAGLILTIQLQRVSIGTYQVYHTSDITENNWTLLPHEPPTPTALIQEILLPVQLLPEGNSHFLKIVFPFHQ